LYNRFQFKMDEIKLTNRQKEMVVSSSKQNRSSAGVGGGEISIRNM